MKLNIYIEFMTLHDSSVCTLCDASHDSTMTVHWAWESHDNCCSLWLEDGHDLCHCSNGHDLCHCRTADNHDSYCSMQHISGHYVEDRYKWTKMVEEKTIIIRHSFDLKHKSFMLGTLSDVRNTKGTLQHQTHVVLLLPRWNSTVPVVPQDQEL